ncbi:MAG: DUF4105 domain-containing protein [Flammeovirgaceae bacterium]
MRAFVCLLFLFGHLILNGQAQLSGHAKISVVTLGPDKNELYAAFGHSAIRVYDSLQGIDWAYNYGVFDFDQPHFYLNFTRGYLYYKLGVYSYVDFKNAYIRYNRSIHEQILRLNQQQKQKIFDFLQWNAQPQNQTYRYDYYHNNCATKIRDVINQQLGSDIKWDSSFFTPQHSFRNKTSEYLDPLPWGNLGIDICLGLPIDKKMSAWEYMFLPDYVESFFDHAVIRTDSVSASLVAKTIIVFEPPAPESRVSFIHPWIAFGTLAGIVAAFSVWDWRRNKISKWLDVILFGAIGLIGMLLLFLWAFTDHHDAAQNFNLLWAFPIHLIGAFLLLYKKQHHRAKLYFLFSTVLTTLLAGCWFILPQQLNSFLLPLVFIILMRSILLWQVLRLPVNR